MMRFISLIGLFVALVVAPSAARAGWILQWKETAVRHTGDKLDPQTSTMSISKQKVRIAQPQTTSIIDYDKKTFTILNPNQSYFWSGTQEEYVNQMSKDRSAALHTRLGTQAKDMKFERKKVDPKTLPPITVAKTKDELLLEVWLAEDIKVSSDLDPKRFLEYESRLTEAMLGNSAKPFAALYRSEEYGKLLERGYILKSVTHHRAGTYEREVTEIRSADVPATDFDVPENYRRVRLADVMPGAPQS
jgi:hypothetical protein